MKKNYDASAYDNVEAYIYDIPKFTKKNDLKHTEMLLFKLGNPGVTKKIIHVAGTNGKGSVCAYLNSFLLESGKKVGMFTSPHLISMNERIRIDGQIVSKEDFVVGFEQVKEMLTTLPDEIPHPTFFETLFLIAMCIFEKNNVEYIILETGLGGRLDATNVIPKPEITVITKIGLDHCEYLGDTKEKIAEEKAGILKRNVPVVYLKKYTETAKVIEKQALLKGSFLEGLEEESFKIEKFKNKSIDFCYKSRYYDYITFTVPGHALYQVENISMALRAFECMMEKEQIKVDNLRKAIARTNWEGRMEEIADGVYVDGAHNEDGILAFLDAVSHISCEGKKILLFSVVSDKDYKSMIHALTDNNLFTQIIAVPLQDARGLSLEHLKENFSFCHKDAVNYFETVEEGFSYALSEKGEEDMLFVAGSLYLVGHIKALLRRK